MRTTTRKLVGYISLCWLRGIAEGTQTFAEAKQADEADEEGNVGVAVAVSRRLAFAQTHAALLVPPITSFRHNTIPFIGFFEFFVTTTSLKIKNKIDFFKK